MNRADTGVGADGCSTPAGGLALVVLDARSVPAGVYEVDPRRSEVRFRAKALGLMRVRGSMPVVSGTITIVGGHLHGVGEVAADAVSTGLALRDRHLQSSQYLNAARYPRIRVTAQDVDIGRGHAVCSVVLRDTTGVVAVEIRGLSVGDDGVLRVDAEAALDRNPFPMLPPMAGVSRKVDIEVVLFAAARRAVP